MVLLLGFEPELKVRVAITRLCLRVKLKGQAEILNLFQTLISLAREFEELSDTCLLVLHLEVRVHCFHYLQPIWRGPAGAQFSGGQDSTDPNPEVVKLSRDLCQVRWPEVKGHH